MVDGNAGRKIEKREFRKVPRPTRDWPQMSQNDRRNVSSGAPAAFPQPFYRHNPQSRINRFLRFWSGREAPASECCPETQHEFLLMCARSLSPEKM